VTIIEPVRQSENVLVVVKEEGMEKGVPPSDMQCAAQGSKKGTRHKEEIFWDDELRLWSSLCEKHTEQNEQARVNEAKKVVLFSKE